ncbi:MAG: hypothetical protein FJ109_04895 [Deltaproteobacteria bacterium]|nr:hypothetical protein [Deltaproteobacteria bacterium]
MSDLRYIVPLTGVPDADRGLLGGKGLNLQRLVRANFHVPGGFVVTTEAFRAALSVLLPGWRSGGGDLEALERLVLVSPLPEDIGREILAAVGKLRRLTGASFIVRSSATTEDHEHASMAGLAATVANVVSDEDLLAAVRVCWASLLGREGVTYRSLLPRAALLPEMAVVVQQLIPAQRAGVLFTVDPVTGADDRYLISGTWGLGETVVSGRAADTVTVDRRTGAVLRQDVVAKREKLEPMPNGGTRVARVPERMARRPVLDEALVVRLWELAHRVEREFGGPQDLEWAEWDARVYLLQARPVTALRRRQRVVWTSTNVGEALPGVGTPFTWSIIHSFSRQGLVHAFRGLGCTVPEEYPIVGRIRGRIYINLSEFMSVASQVPFMSPHLLQRLAGGGGAEQLPGTYRKLPSLAFLLKVPFTGVRTLAAGTVNPVRVALWNQRFRRFVDEFERADLTLGGSSDLREWWRRADEVFLSTGTLMLECSGQFLMTYVATALALRVLLGGGGTAAERTLFSGLSGVRSAEPGLDLLRMARKVASIPGLRERVLASAPERLLGELRGGDEAERSLASAIEAFLRSHGHRAVREAELSEPRWSEDPAFPLAVLKRCLEAEEPADPEAMLAERRGRREKETQRVLKRVPAPLRPLFRRLLSDAQDSSRLREELRNASVHTMGFFRALALETGRRMAESGLLVRTEDAFFLSREEMLAWLDEPAAGTLYPLAVALRRLEHEVLSALPDLPPFFVMEGDRIVAEETRVAVGRSLSGLAGSPGVATGRVRVVLKPSDAGRLRPGEVLVAPFTDVGWTPLFLVASAVVTELGGPLSHSCVVAREYGVPAVVNVKDAVRLLRDGQLVTVDGDRGVVVVEETAA